MNLTESHDHAIARSVMQLAWDQGLSKECMFRAAIPSLEEIEAQLGRDLVEQARHMVAISHANHGAAAAALDERVGEFRPTDATRVLQFKSCFDAFRAR